MLARLPLPQCGCIPPVSGDPTWHRPTDPDGAYVDGPGVVLAGAPRGPLVGVGLAVKDLLDVAGRTTGAGNPVVAARTGPAVSTAPAVARLVEAGATVVGRTVTDELAYSLSGTNVHLGTPRNPAWPGHEPGGSSAGSASAVAAGTADLGLGTDTGGSIRVPASYCRLLGWRPTHGLVPMTGVVPLSPSFDTVGLLARPTDAALLGIAAEVLAEGLPAASAVTGIVVADDLLADLDPDDAEAVLASARRMASALGVGFERGMVLPFAPPDAATTFRVLQGAEAWTEHGELVSGTDLGLGPGIAARFAAASQVTAEQVAVAVGLRAAGTAALAELTAGGVVIAHAAAAGAPPALGADAALRGRRRLATLALTAPAGLAGAPVVVVPARPPGEPPLGLALVGAPGSDASLLEAVALAAT